MAEHGLVCYTFSHEAALAGNWAIIFQLPHGFMPRHISAVATNDSDATIQVGTTSSAAALLAETTIGDSGDPTEFGPSDFADADYQYAKGDIVQILIDYDGGSGTVAEDVTVVLTGLTGL